MTREKEHIEMMLDIKRQIYETKSWKRRNDLNKHLSRLERDWWEYRKLRDTQ